MKSIQFTNKVYLGYVVLLLSYYLLNSTYLIFQTPSLLAFVPWIIQMIVLMLVALRHKWVRYGLKCWALFFILGSGLQLLGQLLITLGDGDETMDLDKLIRLLVTFLMGIILFYFADSSIKVISKETQEEARTEG